MQALERDKLVECNCESVWKYSDRSQDTDGMIGDEPSDFRPGRGCVDQVFALRQLAGFKARE